MPGEGTVAALVVIVVAVVAAATVVVVAAVVEDATVVVVAEVVTGVVVAAAVVTAVVVVPGVVVTAVTSHERLISTVHLCFKQHSHIDEERYESCSSGDILARAVIFDLAPFKQTVSAPIISG
jgi:hypothetical protein